MKKTAVGADGLTMLETIVAIAVLGIIGLFLISSGGNPARLISEYQLRSTADSEARSTMATIQTLLRSAVPGSIAITNDDPETGATLLSPNTHIRFIYRPNNQAAGTASPTYDIFLTSNLPSRIRVRSTTMDTKTLASNVAYLQINQSPADLSLLDISLKISVPLGGSPTRAHDVELLNQYVRVGSAP